MGILGHLLKTTTSDIYETVRLFKHLFFCSTYCGDSGVWAWLIKPCFCLGLQIHPKNFSNLSWCE